jgi:chromosomal replication initiation ATPase DnaA
MEQLILRIKSDNNFAINDYIVTDSNMEAYQYIANSNKIWGVSPYNKFLLISGSNYSGKTYLAKIWANAVRAEIVPFNNLAREVNNPIIIEDIDFVVDEEELLHLFNCRIMSNHQTLFTSKKIDLSHFKLLDLQSRMKSINRVYIEEPDEKMIKMLLLKLFSDRSIKITNEILNYIIYRIPRDYSSINYLVNKADQETLIFKRDITIPFISKILNDIFSS